MTVGFIQHATYSYHWVVLSKAASQAGMTDLPDGLVGSVSASTER